MKLLALSSVLLPLAALGVILELQRELHDTTAMLRRTTANLNRALAVGELANSQTTQALAACRKLQEILDGVIAQRSTPYQFTNIWQGALTNDFSDTRFSIFDSFKGDTQIFQHGYYDNSETIWQSYYETDSNGCATNFYVFGKFAPIVAYTNGGWQITFAQ